MRLLVIGAGPAGASAAISGRQLGAEVTLIDASAFPRFRPGESLHPGIEPLLAQLDPDLLALQGPCLRYGGQRVRWGAREQFVEFGRDDAGTWLGYQVSRSRFDTGLVEAARRLGVKVLLECRAYEAIFDRDRLAGLHTSRGPLYADCIVDASGSRGWLGRALKRQWTVCSPRLIARFGYGQCLSAPTDLPAITADEIGWTWIAYLGDSQYTWTRVTEPQHREPQSWRPERLTGIEVTRTGGADVTWKIADNTAGDRWFLCGDSAAVLDPSAAHGILRALMSGRMAATLAVAAMERRLEYAAAAQIYDNWFRTWFYHDAEVLKKAYAEAGLFGCACDDPVAGQPAQWLPVEEKRTQ